MDVIVTWKISDDVESLVATIAECKRQLVEASKQKDGDSVTLLSCDVFAGDKLLELLQLSDRWSPLLEMTEEDLLVPPSRRQKKSTELMADFTDFKLHRMPVLGERVIRVVAEFHVNDTSAVQTWYGNVEIVT